MNPFKRIADMWKENWSPRQEILDFDYQNQRGILGPAKTSHRWWIWLPLVLMTVLMLIFFFLWYFKDTTPTSTKEQYEEEDAVLEEKQDAIERQVAEAEERIDENIKEAEKTHDAINRALDNDDDAALLAIYNRLRAEHDSRNAPSEADE